MTQKEIVEGNKLIAEFMGGINAPPFYTIETWDIPNMNGYQYVLFYNSSWDWLMPVIEKIRNSAGACIHSDSDEKKFAFMLFSLGIVTPIETVYMYVINFIKWYNSQSK